MIKKLIIIVILLNSGLITALAQNSNQSKKLREVMIYLLKEPSENDKYDAENPLGIYPVKRRVNATNPLTGAFKELVKGATKAEKRRKYDSSTFGIKFVSVSLKNGEAIAHFTMAESVSFGGDNGPSIFREAVRKTAMQFREVKKVIIFVNGVADDGHEEY